MGNALYVEAYRQYPPVILFGACPKSAISNTFDVPAGYHAELRLHDLPDGWCVTFEEQVCVCCCDLEHYPVCNDCGKPITLGWTRNDHQTLCLTSGTYRATVLDEDGEPVRPASREVIIQATIAPGPCPAKA